MTMPFTGLMPFRPAPVNLPQFGQYKVKTEGLGPQDPRAETTRVQIL